MNPSPPIVLLATDGSEDAVLAARAAVDVCAATGSELHVVHAWHSVPSVHFDAFLRVQFEQEAREVLDAAVERIESGGVSSRGLCCVWDRLRTRSWTWPRTSKRASW